jgi:UDP-N-acetylmuramoyl-L-alanyl-D-glutamate--2,6-diaminopimelate ligase
MKLNQLLIQANISPIAHEFDGVVRGIAEDSRLVKKNDLFVCIQGTHYNGKKFIEEAIRKGAMGVVLEGSARTVISKKIPQIIVQDSRKSLAVLAHQFFGDPSKKIRVLGVTGTKGKTTTTYFIQSILKSRGDKVGLIGTIACEIGEKIYPTANTTPSALIIANRLYKMVNVGCSWAVMEVSSHALALNRVWGLNIAGAVFTNLGRDHLDFHKTISNYFQAKRKLFIDFPAMQMRIINQDDFYGRKLTSELKKKSVSYGIRNRSRYQAKRIELLRGSSRFEVDHQKFEIFFPGLFNIYNALASIALTRELGVPWSTIREGLRRVPPVPGRLEKIELGQPFAIFVDYAHTPDALQAALIAVRSWVGSNGHVICVFGCGGDRDTGKRPLMGKIAASQADYVILTSDNPRSESPQKIIQEILNGIPKTIQKNGVTLEEDRRFAIEKAIQRAQEGDVVLIAGKGHETYQIIKDKKIHLDDRIEVKKALKNSLKSKSVLVSVS